MRVLGAGAVASVGLMGWDAMLHTVTLFVPREEALRLPWILYPTFPTWFAYDLFWASVHFGAAATLIAYWKSRA